MRQAAIGRTRDLSVASASGGLRGWLRTSGLHAYVLLSVTLGVGVFATMVALTAGVSVEPWRLLVVVMLCVLADVRLLETRIGHNLESFTLGELCIVLAVAMVPAPYAVVIAALCVLLFHLARRIALLKAAFNAANIALAVAAAAQVAHLVGTEDLTQLSPRNAVALTLGCVAFFVLNSGGVALAVALSQQVSLASVYRQGLLVRLLVAGGNTVAALVVLCLADWNRSTLLVLPPTLVLMYASYRGYLHASQERDIWQQLDSATRELTSLDEQAVVGAAVSRAAQMLKAHSVSLVLRDGSAAGSTTYVGNELGLRAAAQARDEGTHDGPSAGSETIYTAALEGPSGRLGVLRLSFDGPVQLSSREHQVLTTFAHSVGTALQNARLYSQMRAHVEAEAYEASHDALTGLGNRGLLYERADAVLATAGVDRQCALLIVDLDHFKEINDTLGHAAGDMFLRQVGQRIVAELGAAGTVCRLGGDEFGLLIDGLPTPEQADEVAVRLLNVLAQPVVFDGLRLSVEGSVGVACYPADASSFNELLQRADIALYQAKTSRGSFSHYHPERDGSSLHRLALAAEMRSALAEDQLVVHFQPQFDVRTGVATGAEALVRWEHPHRGLLRPVDFVGAVEQSGLVRDFTLAVLEKAVAECATWKSPGRALTVAVNLSARNLLDSELPFDVRRVLLRHGLAPDRLVLEITETTMMSELDVVEEVLGGLRSLGVQLSVDDFGTGYSSLGFLQRVAVNEVKIDRSFVRGLTSSQSDRALVRATVQLAHSLGARAVAEGVEDQLLVEALRELGCDLAQGFHLAHPLTGEALRTALGLPGRRHPLPGPRPDSDVVHLRAVSGG